MQIIHLNLRSITHVNLTRHMYMCDTYMYFDIIVNVYMLTIKITIDVFEIKLYMYFDIIVNVYMLMIKITIDLLEIKFQMLK